MSGARTLRWPHLARHRLVVALLLVLAPAFALIAARPALLLPAGGGERPVGSSQPSLQMSSGALPRGAVGPVSTALGAVEPSYHLHPGASGARAVNRSQGFVANLTPGGLAVSEGKLAARLHTTAAGFRSSPATVVPAAAHVLANRATYDLPGAQEWYANGPFGLEQGFTVARPASSRAVQGTYTVTMAVSGNARPKLTGGSLVLRSPSGATVRYGDLRAVDAAKRLLPSWFSLRGDTLSLHVRTSRARFPISIDPLLTGEGKAIELGEAKGEAPEKPAFGASVALSGDGNTALVGAPDGEEQIGAAWIFHRQGAVWSQQGKKLTGPPNHEEGACEAEEAPEEEEPVSCAFGTSVALDGEGNTALIGAPAHGARAGVVWVLNRNGSTWEEEEIPLHGPVEAGQEAFGKSVALSNKGDTAMIGAPLEHGGRGQVYLYERAGPGLPWGPGLPLVASGEGPGGHLGSSVALSADGQEGVAGAKLDNLHKGSAFVFEHVGTNWVQNGALSGSTESGEGRFGSTVAMSGDGSTVLVGAPWENSKLGSAWTFVFVSGRWTPFGPKLVGEGKPKEEFGTGLALSSDGGRALIGSPKGHAPERGEGAGSVRIYTAGKSEWSETQALEAGPLEKGNGQFGRSVSMAENGETILVGAPHESNRAGAVWLFGDRPVVEKVAAPNESGKPKGHLDGGNKVLIFGKNLTGALAVWFGSYKAGPERILERVGPYEESPGVLKEKLLVEVPPANQAEEVDVTVETEDWVSAVNTNDGYTYTVGPAEEGKSGGGGGGNGNNNKKHKEPGVPLSNILSPPTTGTGTGTTGSTGTGNGKTGILGTVTSGSSSCKVSLRSSKIPVAGQTRASVSLAAHGSGRCGGHITLQVGFKKGSRTEFKTIASGTYAATGGHNLTATLKLASAGQAMLRSAHGHLKARLLIGRTSPSALKASATNVTLSYAQKKG